MEIDTKSIMENANNNKAELIAKIEAKIEELQALMLEFNDAIKKYLELTKKYDVNFVPDKTIVIKLSYCIDNFINVKQALLELVLDEDNIFDKEKYLKAAQKLLDKIDKEIEEEKAEFVKTNEEKFEQVCKQKRETEIELENLRIELERLETEKAELEMEQVKFQIKRNKAKFKIFKRMHDEELEFNSAFLEDTENDIKRIKARISKLEIMSRANHFVPRTEEDPVNPDSAEIMEENKGIEPGDE